MYHGHGGSLEIHNACCDWLSVDSIDSVARVASACGWLLPTLTCTITVRSVIF